MGRRNIILTAERIQIALAPRPVRFYEQADSTNDLALEWLRQGAQSGAVIVADEQVKGRGRLGRTWYTPAGTALIVSIILRPTRRQISQLTMLGAVAISELLARVGAEQIGIKWPNDVQLGGLKVSGILPEVVWNGTNVEGAVLGMGINVRVDFSDTPLEGAATSIETALSTSVDRLDLLVHLLNRIDYWIPKLGTRSLFDAWRERLTTLGKRVTYAAGTGVAEDVDEDGALLVKGNDGATHRLIAGDIVLGSVW